MRVSLPRRCRRLAWATVGAALAIATAACGTGKSPQPQHTNVPAARFGFDGTLEAVATASPGDAWAVGFSGHYPGERTLMLHWNGSKWSRMASPAVLNGTPGRLMGIAAVSDSDAWAVGYIRPNGTDQSLLLHWNGKLWSRVSSPPPGLAVLTDVTMTPKVGWVVGFSGGGTIEPLIMRWNGSSWTRVPAPAASGGATLNFVAASADAAWATGFSPTTANDHGVLARWNGRSWRWASFPVQGPRVLLTGVATGANGATWAVGYGSANESTAFSIQWPAGDPTGMPTLIKVKAATLVNVAVAPDGTPWAVGATASGTLVMRRTGNAWTTVATPAGHGELNGVAFAAPAYGWAVGSAGAGDATTTPLILHWDGTAWR